MGGSAGGPVRGRDRQDVALMLGREPRGELNVAVRCHLGLPAVISVAPVLPDGEPFPTTFWLTCPLAGRLVAALESDGMIRRWEGEIEPSALSRADRSYARHRAKIVEDMVRSGALPVGAHAPGGGVGGTTGGVKCLHARFAYWLAGGDDPAGLMAARSMGRLDCARSCTETGFVCVVGPQRPDKRRADKRGAENGDVPPVSAVERNEIFA